MAPLDFLALCLATGAVVDAWRSGSIFLGWRARVEAYAELHEATGKRSLLWAPLLDCGFCLSHHVPYVLALASLVPAATWPAWAFWLKLPLYCLAATRASVVLNGILPERIRY